MSRKIIENACCCSVVCNHCVDGKMPSEMIASLSGWTAAGAGAFPFAGSVDGTYILNGSAFSTIYPNCTNCGIGFFKKLGCCNFRDPYSNYFYLAFYLYIQAGILLSGDSAKIRIVVGVTVGASHDTSSECAAENFAMTRVSMGAAYGSTLVKSGDLWQCSNAITASFEGRIGSSTTNFTSYTVGSCLSPHNARMLVCPIRWTSLINDSYAPCGTMIREREDADHVNCCYQLSAGDLAAEWY